jgi:predicted alpha/beta-hydrolase family hydrolase
MRGYFKSLLAIVKSPLIVLAPGAGAPSSHPWMLRWAASLGTVGQVSTFDYRYMTEGRKYPDPLPKLIESHREALRQARQAFRGPAVLIGKSMGSRIGCHVSLEEKVTALICFGYPLCGGGDPRKRREEVLRKLSTPILFIQGTRDPLCPLDLLAEVRAEMRAPNELYVVEGGDHSLAVTKTRLRASGETQDQVDRRILERIRIFLESLEPA